MLHDADDGFHLLCVALLNGTADGGGFFTWAALHGQNQEQGEVDEARRAIKGAGLEPAVIHDVVTPGGESTRVVEIRRRRGG